MKKLKLNKRFITNKNYSVIRKYVIHPLTGVRVSSLLVSDKGIICK
jgi:hypothetical protein